MKKPAKAKRGAKPKAKPKAKKKKVKVRVWEGMLGWHWVVGELHTDFKSRSGAIRAARRWFRKFGVEVEIVE